MRWLLFLFRLAFICGFAFLLSLLSLFYREIENHELLQTLITIGYIIGLIVLPLSLVCYFILWMAGKKPAMIIPAWILIANILFLAILFTYIFYLNDPYYYKR